MYISTRNRLLKHVLAFSIFFFFFSTSAVFADVTYKLQVPLPNYPQSSIDLCTGSSSIECSGIALYIKLVYEWLIRLAIVLGAAALVIAGLLWLTAAGDSKRVDSSKSIIKNTLLGLVLAFGSYALLWTINPNLVEFQGLLLGKKIEAQELKIEIEEDAGADIINPGDPPPPSSVSGLSGLSRPSWDHASFNCSSPPPPCCVLDPSMTAVIPTYSNVTNPNGHSYHKDLIPAIQRLNETAKQISQQDGKKYTIQISSGYRPFQKQVDIWCGRSGNCKSQHPNTADRKGYCAVPGGSNHGHGIALDVGLLVNGSNPGLSYGSNSQCGSSRHYIAKLAQIFFASDPQWKRYEKEIWHFEYNPTTPSRGPYTGLPSKCGG
ncbi:MAG: D-alanyl-D-alanine carboxypeptidase family protein [Patescibacteria group bacterium]